MLVHVKTENCQALQMQIQDGRHFMYSPVSWVWYDGVFATFAMFLAECCEGK